MNVFVINEILSLNFEMLELTANHCKVKTFYV